MVNSLQEEKDKTSMLESDLQTTSSSLEQELSKNVEKEEQLRVLQDCLHQVMDPPQPGGVATEEEGEEEGVAGEEGPDGEGAGPSVTREDQLKKIEAMLDTTKVRMSVIDTLKLEHFMVDFEHSVLCVWEIYGLYQPIDCIVCTTTFFPEHKFPCSKVKKFPLYTTRNVHRMFTECPNASKHNYIKIFFYIYICNFHGFKFGCFFTVKNAFSSLALIIT